MVQEREEALKRELQAQNASHQQSMIDSQLREAERKMGELQQLELRLQQERQRAEAFSSTTLTRR